MYQTFGWIKIDDCVCGICSERGSHSHRMTNPSAENENIYRGLQKTSNKIRIGEKLFENEAFKVGGEFLLYMTISADSV